LLRRTLDCSIGVRFRQGMGAAYMDDVAGARDFSQLITWQLADALRVEVLRHSQREPWAKDWKFKSQTEDAIDSVCRNIAEGFGAETHGGFASYLRISRRSLNELRDALRSALLKRYVSAADLSPAFDLIRRLVPALDKFIAYLERTKDMRQGPAKRKGPRTDER
jgi:four helix bundle protein